MHLLDYKNQDLRNTITIILYQSTARRNWTRYKTIILVLGQQATHVFVPEKGENLVSQMIASVC